MVLQIIATKPFAGRGSHREFVLSNERNKQPTHQSFQWLAQPEAEALIKYANQPPAGGVQGPDAVMEIHAPGLMQPFSPFHERMV